MGGSGGSDHRMSANTKRGTSEEPADKKLPPVTVAKFEAALLLLERLFEAQQESFLQKMQEHRERHTEITQRPLTAGEAADIAVAMREVLGDQAQTAAELQSSDLYAYDMPDSRELLAAAGLATAPALLSAVRQLVALIEMPSATFKKAHADDLLPEALEDAASKFDDLELVEARKRTTDAVAHFASAAGSGDNPGEVLRALIQTVMGALEQAAIRTTKDAASQLASSMLSVEPTDGPAVKS